MFAEPQQRLQVPRGLDQSGLGERRGNLPLDTDLNGA